MSDGKSNSLCIINARVCIYDYLVHLTTRNG
jgi:hypothetical protein